MSRRPASSIVASPVLVGAVTVLIAIVAVFLAYNANQGLPFVPTYDVSAELHGGSNLVNGNDVQARRPTRRTGRGDQAGDRRGDRRHDRGHRHEARQGRRATAGGHLREDQATLAARAQVRRIDARAERRELLGRRHDPAEELDRVDRARGLLQHLRLRHAQQPAPGARGVRYGVRGPGRQRSTRSSRTSSRS